MKCPNCESTEIRKNGLYRGKQRYQCKNCARQFVETHHRNLHEQPSTGVEERIHRYIQSISTTPSDLLVNLHRDTVGYPLAKMQPTLEQVRFIALALQSMAASRVLEIGIFSGYCTLALALALPEDGRLISCGVDGEHLTVARNYWLEGGVAGKIDLRIGNGLDVLDSLLSGDAEGLSTGDRQLFDSIVICGRKHLYPQYYLRAIELLRSGGLLFTTDVLWQNKVLNLEAYNDELTGGIDRFNQTLATDDRVRVSVLPIGDGLSVAMKI